jgi:hypothetical protein
LHTSAVQTSPSLHSGFEVQLVIGVLVHVPAEQTSAVAGFPSLQFALIVQQPGVGVYVPPHEPDPQASGVVQALPSLHDAVLFACAHPVGLAQESSVQALPSSQLGAEPAWQHGSSTSRYRYRDCRQHNRR